MAIQTIPAGMWIPRIYPRNNVPAIKSYATVSNAAGKMAWLIQAPKAGNIRKVVWATRNVGTGATVDVRLETIDTTVNPARPSGTLLGTNTNGSQVVASSDDNTVFATTLTADATVTLGQQFAVVVANASPGNMEFAALAGGMSEGEGFPYCADYDGANWITFRSGYIPALSLEYDDGTYAPICGVYPACNDVASVTINTGTTPDTAGLLFQLPFPARIRGFWIGFNFDGNYVARLVTTAYNQSAGTGILASVTVDKDLSGDGTNKVQKFVFDTAVELDAATNYRLIIEPSTATSCLVYYINLGSAARMDAWEGGAAFCLTTAKDPTGNASWTDYNSGTFRIPFIGLWLDGFSDGGGGGASGGSYAFAG